MDGVEKVLVAAPILLVITPQIDQVVDVSFWTLPAEVKSSDVIGV